MLLIYFTGCEKARGSGSADPRRHYFCVDSSFFVRGCLREFAHVRATGCIERSPQDKRRAERPDFPHVRRGVLSGVPKTRGGQKGGVSGGVTKASGGQKKGVSSGVPKTRGGKRGQGRKIRDGGQGASVEVAMGGAQRGSQQPAQFAQFRQNACECRGLRPADAASCRCLVRLSELSAGPAHAGRVANQQDS